MKFLLLAAAAARVGAERATDRVVLTIGTEKITKSKFEEIIAGLPEPQRAAIKDPASRKKIAEQLAELKTLAQEARARKLEQSTKLQLQFDQVLAQAGFLELAAAKPDEAAIKAYYETNKKNWEKVSARHIPIRFTGSRVPVRPHHADLSEAAALKKAQEVRRKIAG